MHWKDECLFPFVIRTEFCFQLIPLGNKDTPHYKLMVLLEQELPEASRREKIDELGNCGPGGPSIHVIF